MKIKIGDIFEIETPKGKAYLHYISKDKDNIPLIRVLAGLYAERPKNFSEIAKQKERCLASFALGAALYHKFIERVGHYPADGFEISKYRRAVNSVRGVFLGWDIVDTHTLKRTLVQDLTLEQKKLSPYGIMNYALLIDLLVKDWTPEKWVPSNL